MDLSRWLHVLQDGTGLHETPRVRSHLNFPAGRACAVSSISSLCISTCLICRAGLPSPAHGGFWEQVGVLCPAQQPNHGAESPPAPSPLLRSSRASFGAPWHPNSPDFPGGEGVLSCQGVRREPEGLWGHAWLRVTPWGSFSGCSSRRKLCRRRISRLCSALSFRQRLQPCPRCHPSAVSWRGQTLAQSGFLVPLVRFYHFSAFLPSHLFPPEASAGAGPPKAPFDKICAYGRTFLVGRRRCLLRVVPSLDDGSVCFPCV